MAAAKHCKQTTFFICCMLCLFSLIFCISDEEEFKLFIKKYNKSYEKQEFHDRFQAFKQSLNRIRILNKGHDWYDPLYGITKYSDLTPEEFRGKVLKQRGKTVTTRESYAVSRRKRAINLPSISVLPQRVDWRESKVINPVRNQGECGACWAFSTVETLESMYAIHTSQLPLLSVQQVIDCAGNGNYGCQGGDTCTALTWMNSTKVNLVPDNIYPFTHNTGSCRTLNASSGIQLESYSCQDYVNKEADMVKLLANHGPLVVAVDATLWQDYLGGIIKFHCETNHNHAVQIVGYDLTGPVPYYIIRNSWGVDFGVNGYLYIAIGKNLCGIANEVAYLDTVY